MVLFITFFKLDTGSTYSYIGTSGKKDSKTPMSFFLLKSPSRFGCQYASDLNKSNNMILF